MEKGRVGVTRCGPPQHELPNMNLYPFSANPLHLRWKPPNELSVQCQLETSQCLHGLPRSSRIPSLTIEKLSNSLSRAGSQEQPGLQQVIQSPQTAESKNRPLRQGPLFPQKISLGRGHGRTSAIFPGSADSQPQPC